MTDRKMMVADAIAKIIVVLDTIIVMFVAISGIILCIGMTMVDWNEKFYGIGEIKTLEMEEVEDVELEEKTEENYCFRTFYLKNDLGSYNGRPLYSVMKERGIEPCH